jgi:hypothetical protein
MQGICSRQAIDSERNRNMRLAKFILPMALFLVPSAAPLNAQTLQAAIAGSSGFWIEAGQAAYSLGGTTTTCVWTSTNNTGTNSVVDSRSLPGTPFAVDYGSLWVTWTSGSTGTCAAPSADSQVWAYISLDAVLGVRCFFAQPECTLSTNASAGTAGVNGLLSITDTALPANILTTFNGQPISIAASDILPADAKFSTYSTLARCGKLGPGTQYIGLGYGPGGANKTAGLSNTRLIRKSPNGPQETRVNLSKIMAGKDRDLRLEDGDVLFVPSSKGKAVAYRGLEATVSLLSGLAIYGRL